MKKSDKIYVAGHAGLVGSAVVRRLEALNYQNLLSRTSKELDLRDQQAVETLFNEERPDHVILCAAKVGGIMANASYPVDFLYDNLMIQNHVIHAAWKYGVKRLIFLGSSCIYPRDCPQPIKEEYLLSGPLELTNRPYAVAKIAGIELCWAYNRQYGTQYVALMPTNLYGPNDNYDLNNSHVLPALIRKFHEAKESNLPSVTLWGSGSVRREFLHSDDLAAAAIQVLELEQEGYASLLASKKEPPVINVGYGSDVTIRELATIVANAVGFTGEIFWDTSKPDGTPRKLLDSSKILALGWKPQIPLEKGIDHVYCEFDSKVCFR